MAELHWRKFPYLEENMFLVIGAVGDCLQVDMAEMAPRNWVYIGSGVSAAIYFDPTTIVNTGSYRKAWFLSNAKKQGMGPQTHLPHWSETQMNYFACAQRTMFAAQNIKYAAGNATGNVLESWTLKVSDMSFTDIAPNSLGWSMYSAVCNPKQRKANRRADHESVTGMNAVGKARLSPAELKARSKGKMPNELTP